MLIIILNLCTRNNTIDISIGLYIMIDPFTIDMMVPITTNKPKIGVFSKWCGCNDHITTVIVLSFQSIVISSVDCSYLHDNLDSTIFLWVLMLMRHN